MLMPDGQFYVYIHRRRDNQNPFYVGCSKIHDRVWKRIQDGTYGIRKPVTTGADLYRRAFSISGRRPRWHEVFSKCGHTVEIDGTFVSREAAHQREEELVAKYGRESDGGILTNEGAGGPGVKGFKDTPETCRKKSEQQRGEKNSMYGRCGSLHGQSKQVVDDQTGEIFSCVREAAESRGIKPKTLYQYLDGTRPNKTTLRKSDAVLQD